VTSAKSSRLAPIAKAAAPWLALPSIAALLLRFPPEQYSFYPRCPIYTYLHLQCPGCGTTRALAALLHGHFAEALHLNPLTVLLLPLLMLYLAYSHARGKEPFSTLPQPAIYGTLIVTAAFMLLRNLSA